MIMQGCVISCGTVVFFQKSRNLSRSLLTNNNFYCELGFENLTSSPKFVTAPSCLMFLKSFVS